MTSHSKELIWHPPQKIPSFKEMVSGMLEASKEQLNNMEKVKGKAHILDDVTINRIIKMHTEQNEITSLLIQQCHLWYKEKLTSGQIKAVDEIKEKTIMLKNINDQILFLAEYYKSNTIDKILAMDPADLALAVVNRQIDLP